MLTNEAIVLAGGLGTRLQHVLPDIPKCMAPINGKPFLTFVLDYLENQNIDKVILSVGYRKEHIINYFGKSYRSLKIIYSIENDSKEWAGVRDEKKKRKRIRTRFIFDFKSKQKSNGGLSHHYAGIVVYTDLFFIKRFLESTWY